MSRTETFKFDLNDKVMIREIQRPGKVEAILIDYMGLQYRVSYWDNSERKNTFLPGDELDPRQ